MRFLLSSNGLTKGPIHAPPVDNTESTAHSLNCYLNTLIARSSLGNRTEGMKP